MRIIAALMLIVCIATGAELALAFDPWSQRDLIMHGTFTALTAIDMAQTLKIARNPDDYHERNPILGEHPSQGDVLVYFAATWAAQTLLVHVLPARLRPFAQAVMIAVPLGCVINNLSVGIGFGF